MSDKLPDWSKLKGFEWDAGNIDKNWQKHEVTNQEAMEVFVNRPLIVFYDKEHSGKEDRWAVLGQTDRQRKLTIIFTIRGRKIRVISARDQGKEERKLYG